MTESIVCPNCKLIFNAMDYKNHICNLRSLGGKNDLAYIEEEQGTGALFEGTDD